MSMPSFPQNGADMTRDEALTMIIASIAMEELALSHILNAGGEHLQFVLGALPGTSSQDILAAHKSITALIEAATNNQMLLKNKLDHVLEFVPRPSEPSQPTFPVQPPSPPPTPPTPPPPPPFYIPVCPTPFPPQYTVPWPPARPAPYQVLPCAKSALQLAGQREKMLWEPDSCLCWRQRSRTGRNICWNRCAPEQIQLNPGKRYLVQYTMNVCVASPAEETIKILLSQSPCGAFADTPPLCLPSQCQTPGPQPLHHVSVLHPCASCGCGAALSLVLDSQTPLCVERASMDIIEL